MLLVCLFKMLFGPNLMVTERRHHLEWAPFHCQWRETPKGIWGDQDAKSPSPLYRNTLVCRLGPGVLGWTQTLGDKRQQDSGLYSWQQSWGDGSPGSREAAWRAVYLVEGQEGDKRLKNVIEDLLTFLGMVIKFIYSYGKFGEGRKSNLNAEFSQDHCKWLALVVPPKVNRVAGRSDWSARDKWQVLTWQIMYLKLL